MLGLPQVSKWRVLIFAIAITVSGMIYHIPAEQRSRETAKVAQPVKIAYKDDSLAAVRKVPAVNSNQIYRNSANHLRPVNHVNAADAHDSRAKSKKIVLGYTMMYGYPFKVSMTNCRKYACEWTNDIRRYGDSDAVVFHLFNNPDTHDFVIQNLPERRDQEQKWVLLSREPQGFYDRHQMQALDDLFNLTVSFQYDSDAVIPYGVYRAWGMAPKVLSNYLTAGKSRMAAWAVSNCVTSSRRERFVEELQKYIEVDVYGKCGTIRDHGNTYYARNKLKDNYKFYLAFENSDCVDYVSEKFWNSLTAGIIPIVRGKMADYKKLAPPNSYIHADDFESVEALADYMKLVASNATLYNSYHEWRLKYRAYDTFITPNTNWMCDLCERVHNSKPKTVKVSDMFSEEGRCKSHRINTDDISQERRKNLTWTKETTR